MTDIISCNLTDILTGGIHLDNCSGCSLSGNTLDMDVNNRFGIYLMNSESNKINKNAINNSVDGIVFSPICSGNTVEYNNIFSNVNSCDIFFHDKNDFYNTSCPGMCVENSPDVPNVQLCLKCQNR